MPRAIPPHVRDAWAARSVEHLRQRLALAGAGPIGAVAFDAYGTLLDLGAIEAACAAVAPDAAAFAAGWRAKQLEYSWLRGLMGRYADFAAVTAEALDHALARFGLHPDARAKRALLAAWRHLEPFPEAADALAALAPRPLAVLSNGSPAMLDAALRHADLAGHFPAVLSADAARTYKPDPRVYALAPAALGLPAAQILFVSANPWDAVGAAACGFPVAWVNRDGRPFDTHGAAPTLEVRSLAQLAGALAE